MAIGLINPDMGGVAAVAVAVANEYIAGNGFCPNGDELWIYFSECATGPNYPQVVCRPVSYSGGG
ncbi:hypothetical protein [Microbacterium yannicii]|uniref:hypothetical protein n=1 Tax=Microbacterium yannicii TaxID=671622 RepID=UPI0012FA9D0F|nr:hypothetical protein [Microbacterium yannicii]